MIELMMGGSTAPMPSLCSKWSTIHCSHAFSALSRDRCQPRRSISFKVASVVLKKVFQKQRRALVVGGVSGTISLMLAVAGTANEGFMAQMMASGTTMPRDHEDIS